MIAHNDVLHQLVFECKRTLKHLKWTVTGAEMVSSRYVLPSELKREILVRISMANASPLLLHGAFTGVKPVGYLPYIFWVDNSSRPFPRATVASMASLFHLSSHSRKGSKDPDVSANGGSQKSEDARVSVEDVYDITPGELTFEEGTLLKFLSV